MRLKQNPYHLLLLTGLVLVVTSFLLNPNRTIDIHLRDTYYVLAQGYFFILLAFIVLVLWALYLLTRNILYFKSLTWAHVILTLVTLLILLLLLNFGADKINQSPKRYFDKSNWATFNRYEQNERWITYIIVALLFGQVIFIVNLLIGIIKRVK